ncbi:MAG: hypothetical protein WBA90_11010 [Albidovulum sp.]
MAAFLIKAFSNVQTRRSSASADTSVLNISKIGTATAVPIMTIMIGATTMLNPTPTPA